MDNEIFRKKTVERISSPEELKDYLRVTSPSVWLVLAALGVIIVGGLVWVLCSKPELLQFFVS